jgi:hypothetical protein
VDAMIAMGFTVGLVGMLSQVPLFCWGCLMCRIRQSSVLGNACLLAEAISKSHQVTTLSPSHRADWNRHFKIVLHNLSVLVIKYSSWWTLAKICKKI